MSGLIKVGSATFFDSENKINLPMEKRGIGYVFQDGRLFPHMSVEENLDFGRKRSDDKTSRKKEIIELLGLGQLLQRKPSTLSGGERQRTAIGRAILSGPSFLFMDEPLAALDFARKQEIEKRLDKPALKARIKRIAKRIFKDVRKKEVQRKKG